MLQLIICREKIQRKKENQMAFKATSLKCISLSLLLLMQSAGATVNIIGLPVTSSWVMVKTASTWVRSQ